MSNKFIKIIPHITEKAFTLASNNKYVFVVDTSVNKNTVALEIEKHFKVEVQKVNMINIQGKIKRGKQGMGTRKDVQKAIVTLKPGHRIQIFDTEEESKDKKKSSNKEK